MTLPQFSTVFALLATQLRATDADAATIRGYYEALKHLDLELVAAAAKRLASAANPGAWFPRTTEWIAMVTTVDAESRRHQAEQLSKLATPLCAACGDHGWVPDTSRSMTPVTHLRRQRDGTVAAVNVLPSPGVKHCDCQEVRRLERLGRRPLPTLPPLAVASAQVMTGSLRELIERETGRRMRIRSIPNTHASRLARDQDQDGEEA